jgi:drug/metabolite transporter (DMT)-like permease
MLLLCALFWGGTFVAIEHALQEVPPYLMVGLRFTAAGLLFLPFFFFWRRRRDGAAKTSFHGGSGSVLAGLTLGLLSFAGYGLQTEGLVHTSPARSAFITQLLVVFTFPMQILFLRRRVIFSAYVGLLFVLMGAYLLLGSPASGQWNRGDWLTIACALSFAGLIVLLDVFARKYHPADLVFYQILATGLLALMASAAGMDAGHASFNGFYDLGWNTGVWVSMIYLCLPATIGTIFLQVRYQKETSPARASLLYAMEPVFAGIFAYLLLNQFLGMRESFGAALIVLGVIISETFSSKKPDAQKSRSQLDGAQEPEK